VSPVADPGDASVAVLDAGLLFPSEPNYCQEAWRDWLRPCGSCDAGLPMSCACPSGDPRSVILALAERIDAAMALAPRSWDEDDADSAEARSARAYNSALGQVRGLLTSAGESRG
jgi:hypothetical protein